MGSGVILIKSFVADYCNNSNRHQEKTMPETVFLFCAERVINLFRNTHIIELLRIKYRFRDRCKSVDVHVATTLYELIEAVSEQVPLDEEYLLTPAVLKLLKDCGAGFLFNGSN